MKKTVLIAVLVFMITVVFSSGCVSTPDPIVGDWELTSDFLFSDLFIYELTFSKDNTGELRRIYYTNRTETYPLIWEKTGDNSYQYETFNQLTFSKDGKTLIGFGGEEYVLGKSKGYDAWTHVFVDDQVDYVTYILLDDGLGIQDISYVDGQFSSIVIGWDKYGDKIVFWPANTYVFTNDGKLRTNMDDTAFENNGDIWVESPQSGNSVTTYQFLNDNEGLRTVSRVNTGEIVTSTMFYFSPIDNVNMDGVRDAGVLKWRQISNINLRAEVTLIDGDSGDLFQKVVQEI